MSVVDYEVIDGVSLLRLNRPERLNAVVPALTDGLLDGFERASADGSPVVIMAGRGRAFCAGHDLKEPTVEETVVEARNRLQRIQDVTRVIRAYPGVVIAAVHGYALGAGAEFALSADLVVAAEDAQFGFPEVGVGLSVTGGISRLLPIVLGPARAKALLFLGERMTAEQAASVGLINEAVPAGEHEAAALRMAVRLREQPSTALHLAKAAIDDGLDLTVAQTLDREVDNALLTMSSGESADPAQAFRSRSTAD